MAGVGGRTGQLRASITEPRRPGKPVFLLTFPWQQGGWSDKDPAPLNNGQRPEHGTWHFRGQSYHAQAPSRASCQQAGRKQHSPSPAAILLHPGWRGRTSAPKEGTWRRPSQGLGTGWGRLQLLPPSLSNRMPSFGPHKLVHGGPDPQIIRKRPHVETGPLRWNY